MAVTTVVVPYAVLELPAWLLAGVVLGAVLSALVGLAFVLGRRRFAAGGATGAGRSGDDRRRREIRRYLEAIGEPYREGAEIAGSTVAFHLPERGLAITFDARAYFRIEETGLDAVLLEHELPGANLGSRLPFETPEFGVGASRDAGTAATASRRSGPSRTASGTGARAAAAARERAAERRRIHAAFAALGLPPDADVDAVRSAYRRRVKDVHPDQGGDSLQFQRVAEAYELATEHADGV